MGKTIPPINAELDFLDKNEHEIYCVSNWVQTSIDGKMTPVRITAIHHDGVIVSNSSSSTKPLGVNRILENLYDILSKSKDTFSTKSALCVHYAAILIELDNAIVRLNIDKNILKKVIINGKWHIDYKNWATLLKEAGKNWGYKDFKETDDVCYFYPGFDYKQFITEHETFWEALHDKLDALVKILEKMDSYVNGNREHLKAKPHNSITIYNENQEIPTLYISYSWSIYEKIDTLCQELQKARITFNRDIKDCGYRDNIKNYEREIGKGARVLAYIDDNYLKSINCMYELALIFIHGDVEKRLYPIVATHKRLDAAFSKDLYEYWETEYQKKKTILNDLPSGASLQAINEIGYCDLIIRELPKIVNYLSEVNTLSVDELSADHFKLLIEELSKH